LTRNSAELLQAWLLAHQISISFVPTPLAERLLALEWPSSTPLRLLLTGGDTLYRFPAEDLPFTLVNNYGPTECTVVATSGVVQTGSTVEPVPLIGRPIANTHIHFLNERLQPVRPGAPGEMYIGGASLARGYRNRPDLTAERFIPDPFCAEPHARLYRTGDLGRRLPDGQIAFLGRADDQIKIRGFRIEPAEIAAALNRHSAVIQSVVTAREDVPGDSRLVAYLVLVPNARVKPSELRTMLREGLPEFMVPSLFISLQTLPLTAHGKIDRAALPAPNPANIMHEEATARNLSETEGQISKIVSSLVGAENIGPDEDFFLVGGHSLLGAQLIARLHASFGVEIGLRCLFEAPTVSGLAAEVERLRRRQTA
jgi:acyl-CoA synthetase (AMP-forming)/AMP-acid ligase II